MKVIIQNLQKRHGLMGKLIDDHSTLADPIDVFLAQEIAIKTERDDLLCSSCFAHFTSSMGYGTGIYCKSGLSNHRHIKSPISELGGFITKKTTIAHGKNCDLVSFHGYNGTPFRDVHSLVLHVEAVIDVLTHGVPCIFAGDFNTWTTEHLTAVKDTLSRVGFILAFSWSYPGREFPLDHVFLRGVRLVNAETFRSEADHLGAVIDVEFLRDLVEKEVYVCTGYDGKEIVKEGQQ